MTLQLPTYLIVSLRTDDPVVRSLEGILVSADFFVDGRYYYGALLGLTDASGRLQVPGDNILARYRESQLGGMMDYQVPVEQCDPEIAIRILGGGDFRLTQILVPGSAHVSPWAQDLWARARNVDLAPAQAMLRLDAPRSEAAITMTIASGPSGHGFWRRLTSA